MSKIKTVTKLDYYNGENEVKEGDFRISASSIADFLNYTTQWWRQNFLGEEGFTGSTSSVLGTCVHYIGEMYGTKKDVTDEDKAEIEKYIQQFEDPENEAYNPDIDTSTIRAQWPLMGMALINTYLQQNMPSMSEEFLYQELLPGIGLGGSCDNVTQDIVVDYKTFGGLSAPKTITFKYRLQLLVYAYLYRLRGIHITRIRIVYISRSEINRVSEKTGKPLKDYPSTTSVITEEISDTDIQYIEGIAKLIADSVHVWHTHPGGRYLLAQDYRLKDKF